MGNVYRDKQGKVTGRITSHQLTAWLYNDQGDEMVIRVSRYQAKKWHALLYDVDGTDLAYVDQDDYYTHLCDDPVNEYPLLISQDKARIVAGCRHWSVEEALEHWQHIVADYDHEGDRVERAMAFITALEAL